MVAKRRGHGENTVFFSDPQPVSGQTGPSLYYRPEARAGNSLDVQEELQKDMDAKVTQRKEQQNFHGYHLLPNSCEARTLDGHDARRCIAEFTTGTGEVMAEYLTFVRSNSMLALFFGSVPAAGLASFRKRFDPVIESLRMP